MSNLGTDFSCVDDLDPNLSSIDGRIGLGQAAARRISTARTTLFYDNEYGTDVRSQLNERHREEITAQAVEAEVLKDERVQDVEATITFVEVPQSADETDGDLRIELLLTDASGPFQLTISVSGLTVTLLET